LIRQNLNQAASQAKLQWCLKKERDLLETRVEERTQELESSKVFQEQVLDSIDAELCLLDQAGDIIFANKRWQSFGQDDPDLQKLPAVNENFFDACEKEHDSRYNVELASAIREIRDEKRKEFLMEYSCDSGPRQRWFHLKVNRVKLSTGTAISLMQHDISGAKRDQARAASFAKLIMDSPSEVYIFDADSFRFVEINQGACNNLGYVRSEMLAMSPADIKPDFSEQQLREHCNALTTGLVDSQHFETTHERKDGSTYCVSIDLHCSTLQGRKVLVAFATDVTDRKKLEQQLGESRKLESVGQLAAGVAHEINTPMQCVFGNVEFLQTSFERLLMLSDRIVEMLEQSSVDWDEERKTLNELRESYRYDYLRAQTPDAIAEAADASNRVISIIRAMKIMSHPGSSAKSATDVHDMIQSAATITRGRWKRCAEMVFDFDPELTMVDLLPAEISQVFMNLIVNAADAIMEKIGETPSELGKITISTHCDSEWVTLCFSDTGSGMPDSVKSRIFDPFFTTKEVGRGTGQGLSICRDVIVKRHSGTLEVQSDIGSGTEFKIRIPRHCVPTHGPDQDANPIIAPVTVPAAVHSGSISVN
jgi:PAS domain S-box-containing protein